MSPPNGGEGFPLGVLALLGHFGAIAVLSPYAFWFGIDGLALLAIGCLVRNL